MGRPTDIAVRSAAVWFLPVVTRVPLKFGTEALRSVTCARVRVEVETPGGQTAEGWGETPLSVQWVWPSDEPYGPRHESLKSLCCRLAEAWVLFGESGHPLELGHDFQRGPLRDAHAEANLHATGPSPMPHLAALVACSPFDIALHDAYGNVHQMDVYRTYEAAWMNRDLSDFLSSDEPDVDFRGRHPADCLVDSPPDRLLAWHLVGGLDPLEPADLSGDEPDDGHPVLLRDWIATDGLRCLKIKLRGNDAHWDFDRLVRVGTIGLETGATRLTADFNCTVTDPAYVNAILDRLKTEHPAIHGAIEYVEQPFPYDLEAHRIDVHSVSKRKPLFLDESAHDWKYVRLGRQLGWTGVALKTCKTQTGAILSACWAKAHNMPLMVQDLTNPMLAQIPHCRLAAEVGTIGGVETNGMQFYPDASAPEAAVHPGLYRRREGHVDLSTLEGPGFGYRLGEIDRSLPEPAAEVGK
ncbi:MAG: enolase C-terminal domain-like protein [Phycisphaeraceae bacterium]|nr:enolase C-terminal domain-like protein [Phycisphaeraceae bacterium]